MMNHSLFYFNNNTHDINVAEKKYNFLRENDSSIINHNKAINKLCLDKQQDIVRLKRKNLSAHESEKILQYYREYALKNKLFL